MRSILNIIAGLCLAVVAAENTLAAQAGDVYPAAIFEFAEKSDHLSGMGEKISDIIFANLAADPGIVLVNRDEMQKVLDEAALNLSGMVNSQQANQVGMLTGARIIVTGTIFEIENKLMLVAKIIGTETSRVFGATVKGESNDSVLSLTEELATKIAATIADNADALVAKPVSNLDRLAVLQRNLGSAQRPSLTIKISEHHINRAAVDPAAETEMMFYGIESGFEVIDHVSNKSANADILITGQGFTEFATRKGDIVGVKARLEVKAVDQATNQIVAVDRQTVIEVDLSEMIAGKRALERASAMIAERILLKIVER